LRLILFLLGGFLPFVLSAQDGTLVYEKSIKSVVTITGEGFIGSGFLIAPQIVATNYHVVSGLSSAECYTDHNGPRYKIDGFILADSVNDLAILKVSDLKQKPLTLATDCPATGQRIYVIGSPKGLEGTITEGIISALRDIDGLQQIQMSAAISPGNSGGPVLNAKGEVIGVSVAKLITGESLNFAVPIDTLKKLMSGSWGNLRPLKDLPQMELEKDDESEHTDMRSAELIYDLVISEDDTPLTLNYMAHFRDSTCFYFCYDMKEAQDSFQLAKVWLNDYRLVDIGSGEIIKAIGSDLFSHSESDPRMVYRGTRTFFYVTFPRLSPKVRNFHLMEGNCEEDAYCFRNIKLKDYKTADGLDWYSYENNNDEGTISFYTKMKEEKITVTLGHRNFGTLSEAWIGAEEKPSCGNTGNSVLTARRPIGKHTYKAVSEKLTLQGEVESTREGCLVVELKENK